MDYAQYDHQRSGKMGGGAPGGGLAVDEGIKYEEEKIAERAEGDIAGRDNYSKYQHLK